MHILGHRGITDSVVAHIKRALNSGLTADEILEACLVSLMSGGAPTLVCGVSAIMQAEKELSQSNEEE